MNISKEDYDRIFKMVMELPKPTSRDYNRKAPLWALHLYYLLVSHQYTASALRKRSRRVKGSAYGALLAALAERRDLSGWEAFCVVTAVRDLLSRRRTV